MHDKSMDFLDSNDDNELIKDGLRNMSPLAEIIKTMKAKYQKIAMAIILLVTIFLSISLSLGKMDNPVPLYSNYNTNVHIEDDWDPDGHKIFQDQFRNEDIEYWSYDMNEIPRVRNRILVSTVNVTTQIQNRQKHHMAVAESKFDAKYVDLELRSYFSNIVTESGQSIGQLCKAYEFKDSIQFSSNSIGLKSHLPRVRGQLLKEGSEKSSLINHIAKIKNYDERSAIEKQVMATSTVMLWSKTYYCYFAYTRVVFSSEGSNEKPTFAVINGQAYNRNWEEVAVPVDFIDESKPQEYKNYMDQISREYGADKNCDDVEKNEMDKCLLLSPCKDIPDGEERRQCEEEKCSAKAKQESDRCKDKLSKNKDIAKEKQEIANGKFTFRYPGVLDVPYDIQTSPSGPEQLRSVMRENENGRMEPLIVYSINGQEGREHFVYLPDRRKDSIVLLRFDDTSKDMEALNWVPFVRREDAGSSISKGSIHLVSSLSPLKIQRCTLDDGECELIYDASVFGSSETEHGTAILNTGTNFVPLPEMVPEMRDRNIWVSISTIQVEQCADEKNSARPLLVVLEEYKGKYSILSVSGLFEFELEDEKHSELHKMKLLRPDSIISWDAKYQDKETLEYEDYLQVTMGNGDMESSVIRFKGILKYILRSFKKPGLNDHLDIDSDLTNKLYGSALCAKIDITRMCGKK